MTPAARRPAGIARRLGITLVALTVLLWIAGAAVSLTVSNRALDRAFDGALVETAHRILPLAVAEIVNGDAIDRVPRPSRVPSLAATDESYRYVVRDRAGAILLQSRDAVPADFPLRPAAGFTEAGGFRYYAESAIQGAYWIQIADPLARRDTAVLDAAFGLVAPLPVVLAITAAGIWLLVRRGLAPLSGLRRQIEARHADALEPVVLADPPAEIAPLVTELNRLMRRVERTIEAERSFTANSAHELRTPIAGALAQVQRLVAEAPSGPLRERARRVEAGLRALADLAAKLLELARADAGEPPPAEPADLDAIVDHVVADVGRATGASARIALSRTAPFRARIDPDAFAILLRNLVENACRHGEPSAPVEITIDEGGIAVANDCAPLPAAELDRLRRRFERGTASSGSGLGLSIVEAVARANGLHLALRSPRPGTGRGFEAAVSV